MKTNEKFSPIWSIGLKVGLLTCLALVVYFLFMKMLNLHMILELRLFNFVILAAGISYGIYKLKHELREGEYYLQGLAQGFLIAVVAVTSFAGLFVLYLLFLDQGLLEHIRNAFSPNLTYINIMSVFIALIMEGFASGAIISFCAMQYFKRNHEQETTPVEQNDRVKVR